MSDEEFYGAAFPALREAERILFELASHYQAAESPSARIKPIEKCLSRIKTAESMTSKLLRKNLK